jgi:myo-inositol-1(or 4)-monophosphatase
MEPTETRKLLDLAVAITQAAGDVIKGYYRSAYEAWDKKPDNPVTDADLAADTLLRERLTAATPDFGWLSEETRDTPERLDKWRMTNQCWV